MTQILEDVCIRPPLAHELPAVAALLSRVFRWAYGREIPDAQLTTFLHETFSEEQIAIDLAHSGVFYAVAIYHGAVIGVSRLERVPPPGLPALTEAIELAKCYVLPEYHGHGVAAALLQAAIALAQDLQRSQIWLCVWEQNPRAVAFYHKHGFRVIGTTDVWVGTVRFVDLLMLRELLPVSPAG